MEENGHSDVSISHEDKKLYNFVRNARSRLKLQKESKTAQHFSQDQIAQLDALGFKWKVHKKPRRSTDLFRKISKEVRRFKKSHPDLHAVIDLNEEDARLPENFKQIPAMCQELRFVAPKLAKCRCEALREIGVTMPQVSSEPENESRHNLDLKEDSDTSSDDGVEDAEKVIENRSFGTILTENRNATNRNSAMMDNNTHSKV